MALPIANRGHPPVWQVRRLADRSYAGSATAERVLLESAGVHGFQRAARKQNDEQMIDPHMVIPVAVICDEDVVVIIVALLCVIFLVMVLDILSLEAEENVTIFGCLGAILGAVVIATGISTAC